MSELKIFLTWLTITFLPITENLKPGKYAFKYFHDENNDEKINTNLIGIPKEGYGFSNNAKGFFGKPSYKDVVFQLNSAEDQITIKLD